MKKIFAIALLLGSTCFLTAQVLEVEQTDHIETPKDWKERFFELTHEERGALFADPDVDPKDIAKLIQERRSDLDTPVKSQQGGDVIFGCQLWYDHDQLNVNTLNDSNWELFSGGCGAGQGVDAYWGQVSIDFDFCLLGQTFSHFYINSKGTLSFQEPICDWTPDPFPAATYNQVAGFWADFDFTVSGLCFWEITSEAAIVSFVEVGYWPGQGGLRNTMQMVITDGNSPILPDGYNVGLFYGDMNWAHGGVGGAAGCCGPNPAIVGIDLANNTDGIQIGQFNYLDDTYPGPNEDAGVNWLDNKTFFMMACDDNGDAPENHPPIPTNNNAAFNGEWPTIACDTIRVCLQDTAQFNASYLGPEGDQTITIDVDLSNAAAVETILSTNGQEAIYEAIIIGSVANIGIHEIVITATDNGAPVESVTQTFVIEVIDQEAPVISVSSPGTICSGQYAELSVTPDDLDYYLWSTGDAGGVPTIEIPYSGNFWVTAWDGICSSTASTTLNVTDYFLPQLNYEPSAFVCDGEDVEVCIDGDYPAGTWFDCFEENDDEYPCPEPGYWDGPCAELGPGFYVAHALNEGGCEGRNIFQVFPQASFLPEIEFDPICDGSLEAAVFEGGFANPGEGNLFIQMSDPEGAFANGSFMIVTVNGVQFTFAMLSNGQFDWNLVNQQIPIEFGDEIVVEYIASGVDDGNNNVIILNCGNGEVYSGATSESGILWEGLAACTSEPAVGTWTQDSCPVDGTFGSTTDFNTTFTPPNYGYYVLSFEEQICNVSHEYTLEYTAAPEDVSITPSVDQILCEGDLIEFNADWTVPTECNLSVTWENATVDANNDQEAAYSHPGVYTNEDVELEVSNGCGTVTLDINVESQMNLDNANLDSETFCDGEVVTLCPIDPVTPDMTFEWATGEDTPCIDVEFSGNYEVTITNDCDTEVEASTINIAAIYTGTGEWSPIECNNDFYLLDIGNVYPGYTWCWTDDCINPNEETFLLEGLGEYSVPLYVTDNLNCSTVVTPYYVIIEEAPILNPIPSPSDTLWVCPLEIEALDLGMEGADSYTWMLDCPGEAVYLDVFTPTLDLASDQFPVDCLDQYLELTGTAQNICGPISQTWIVQASLCPITAPNVFSPNEDNLGNDRFILDGIEVYNNTELFVYDRWGSLIFEDPSYDNSWRATDVNDGTYFYVARMLDSKGEVVREVESHLTILRQIYQKNLSRADESVSTAFLCPEYSPQI